MTHLDDAALDAIEQRADNATQGPWSASRKVVDDLHYGPVTATCLEAPSRNLFAVHGMPLADAEFMAHARTDIPALAAAVREARAATTDAEQRAQAAQEALARVRKLADDPYLIPFEGEEDQDGVLVSDLRRALGDDQQEAT